MTTTSLDQIDLLDVGNTIQLYGAIYAGLGKLYLIPLPDENPNDPLTHPIVVVPMSLAEMERFLEQTDVLDVKVGKAILRKSQRQIDQGLSWRVFQRDAYSCRYCGKTGLPLTVDHVDLWEEGGATIEGNLVSACRRCNKTRGNQSYADWLFSSYYLDASEALTPAEREKNVMLIADLPRLRTLRIKRRSR